MQEESGLFQVRFTEEGKKYIKKFAGISYSILVFIFFEAGIVIYLNVKYLLSSAEYPNYLYTTYD
ncbi:MAG TPA: hypothetical protein VF476_00720, partial [Chitinophagaceae bacterium]